MKLRYYQEEARDSAINAIAKGQHPVLQLATGTGKSLIMASLADIYLKQSYEVWCLTHVQQLVEQNANTFRKYSGIEPAVICAGLKRKDTYGGVTFGTIQTVKNMLPELKEPKLIIIDEAHRVPHNEGEPGQYDSILSRYPLASRVAMTATPWRMDNGIIYGNGEQFWFDKLAYNYTVPKAVEDGYLCPLVGVETEVQLNIEGITVNGDFIQSEVDMKETDSWLTAVAQSMSKLAEKRNHIAVYCPTIKAAERTAAIIRQHTGWTVEIMAGGIKGEERKHLLKRFQKGETRVLCSVDMITTGFDFPALDCIVCLRPTLSSSLWVQIQGRGTRLHPSKKNCLVLDYVGNLIRLGGVDMYEKFYREKGLEEVEAKPSKPYVKRERQVLPGLKTLTPINPMTGGKVRDGDSLWVKVNKVGYIPITTRRSEYPVVLVTYSCTTKENARVEAAQFIDTEYPRVNTLEFFKSRRLAVNLPAPAKSLTWQLKGSRTPTMVRATKSGKYWNVTEEYFGEINE